MSAVPEADRQRRVERLLLVGVPLLSAVVLLGCFAAGWPDYWRFVAREDTPLTWYESVLLVLCGVGALQLAGLSWTRGREWRAWLVLGAAFGYLALDERFALHERLRDRVLAPADVRVPFLPWMAPGDYLLLALAAGGLVLVPRLLRLLREDPTSRRLFLAAVVVSAAVIALDTVDIKARSLAVERLMQTGEELVEVTGQVLFVLALWLHAWRQACAGVRPDSPSRPSNDEAPGSAPPVAAGPAVVPAGDPEAADA